MQVRYKNKKHEFTCVTGILLANVIPIGDVKKKKKKEKRQQKQECEVTRRQGQRTHFMKMYFGKIKERGKV